MERQADHLLNCNRMLKSRIIKLESIGEALKLGVSLIQERDCKCAEIVGRIRKAKTEVDDHAGDRSNCMLIRTSVANRTRMWDVSSTAGATSSEEDESGLGHQPHPVVQVPPSQPTMPPPQPTMPAIVVTPPKPQQQLVTVSGTGEISLAPVSKLVSNSQPQSCIIKLETPSQATPQSRIAQQAVAPPTPKTALDVINDTIVRTLQSTAPSGDGTNAAFPTPKAPPPGPLNLVKIVSQPSAVVQPPIRPQSHAPFAVAATSPKAPHSPVILLTTPPSASSSGSTSPTFAVPSPAPNHVSIRASPVEDKPVQVVKCEPDIQLVECHHPPEEVRGGVEPAEICVAGGHGAGRCGGQKCDLSKLTALLDPVTGVAAPNGGEGATMERALIKSRLKIPFWKADDVSSLYLY